MKLLGANRKCAERNRLQIGRERLRQSGIDPGRNSAIPSSVKTSNSIRVGSKSVMGLPGV